VTEKTFAEGLEARQATSKISCELVVRAIARRGKETVRSIPDEAPCIVEGGDYPIGGENRATFVELFLIGRTPVTNRQYAQYLEAIPAGRIGRSPRFSVTCLLSISPGARREPIVIGLATPMAFRAACRPPLSGRPLPAASKGCCFLGV
jgi:hypothetical protein